MGQFDVIAGQSRAESHALRLIVRVDIVDLFAFSADAAFGQFISGSAAIALVGEQRMVARLGFELRQTCVVLNLAFKLIFDFIC